MTDRCLRRKETVKEGGLARRTVELGHKVISHKQAGSGTGLHFSLAVQKTLRELKHMGIIKGINYQIFHTSSKWAAFSPTQWMSVERDPGKKPRRSESWIMALWMLKIMQVLGKALLGLIPAGLQVIPNIGRNACEVGRLPTSRPIGMPARATHTAWCAEPGPSVFLWDC